jgi:hypothetical protein
LLLRRFENLFLVSLSGCFIPFDKVIIYIRCFISL